MSEIDITLETISRMDPASYQLVDMRPADYYVQGTYPGAVNIPDMDPACWQLTEDPAQALKVQDGKTLLTKEKPVYILCHTGLKSPAEADKLSEEGFEAKSVEGGYRTYLKEQLHALMQQEEISAGRRMEIERSLIKTYRKQIWGPFTKAIREYQLIQEGDKIACCISGGKDSMILAKLLQEVQKHGPVKFELVFLCMNPGYNEDNWQIIEDNARLLGLDLEVFNTQIFDIVAGIDKSPCYLCARMRRGYLYDHAKALGCNKIALGHHYDDVIETILMGILYSGKTETMMPKLHSQHFEGMEIIRPLYLVREADIKAWRDHNDLHFIQCACRFTENCASCGGGRTSKRDEVKQLIKELSAKDPIVTRNIFNSVRDINLRTVLGYHKNGEAYNFLDDYDSYASAEEAAGETAAE